MKISLLLFFFLAVLLSACSSGVDPDISAANRIIYNESDSTGPYISSINQDGSDKRRIVKGIYLLAPPVNGRILYTALDSEFSLMMMNVDGSGNRRLDVGARVIFAWLSPNGKSLVYYNDEKLFLTDIQRIGSTNISDRPYFNEQCFSPDGTSYLIRKLHDLSVGDVATGIGHLISSTPAPHMIADAKWSPLGNVILLAERDSLDDSRATMYLINPDGSDKRLIYAGAPFHGPTWSRDGKQIAFIQDDRIRVMNADGTGSRLLTESTPATRATKIHWSHDNQRIVFTAQGDMSSWIAIVNVATGTVTKVADNGSYGFWAQ